MTSTYLVRRFSRPLKTLPQIIVTYTSGYTLRPTYRWWKKSCTSWCSRYPSIHRGFSTIPGCLGFLSSSPWGLVKCLSWTSPSEWSNSLGCRVDGKWIRVAYRHFLSRFLFWKGCVCWMESFCGGYIYLKNKKKIQRRDYGLLYNH